MCRILPYLVHQINQKGECTFRSYSLVIDCSNTDVNVFPQLNFEQIKVGLNC